MRCILIISVSILFYSCKDSKPSGIIAQNKMQEILWDVLRADALSQQLSSRDAAKSLPAENLKLTRQVFSIHNITEEQFEKSYSYYTHHPDMMRTMLDSLNAQKTRMSYGDIDGKHKRFWGGD
jgi:hypothetical protein